jgi:hypothetical protein
MWIKARVVSVRHGGLESNLHNGEIERRHDGALEIVILAEDDFGDDRTWSDRINEGVVDCLRRDAVR